MNQSYEVKLDSFEGPLDLLLHLIYRYEIDIYDIPVAQISEQYMTYIHTMQHLELNVASEYLVMASTLLVLKSQMLLPKQVVEEEDNYEEDPRTELMERLIQYRKYKEAAGYLEENELDAVGSFTRPALPPSESDEMPVIEQTTVSIYDMLSALANVFQRKQWNEPIETTVQRTEISIEHRMQQVLELVNQYEEGILFDHLFTINLRSYVVVTFMAILELMKSNEVICHQTGDFDPIMIFPDRG